ncbi:MAG TPA: hypothetical protein VFT53_07565 [Candidatus Saccharimonadales bacterium]|nr:hypothetical protein [Candidatus Saccharimonadales bacterium]
MTMDASRVQELMFETTIEGYGGDPWLLDTWDEWEEAIGYNSKSVPVPGLGNVSLAESFGGEGQGDQYYLVFKVEFDTSGIVMDTRYYRVDGYWASYDGGEYDGPFYEVQPVEKMVTFYEKVN